MHVLSTREAGVGQRESDLFVPRSWRTCDPASRGFVRGIVKDRAVGNSGYGLTATQNISASFQMERYLPWNSARPRSHEGN